LKMHGCWVTDRSKDGYIKDNLESQMAVFPWILAYNSIPPLFIKVTASKQSYIYWFVSYLAK
jgi:hypothetical protein